MLAVRGRGDGGLLVLAWRNPGLFRPRRRFDADRQKTIFSTTNQTTDECVSWERSPQRPLTQPSRYFMESGDKIRFFLEEGAVAADGKLTVPIERAINKIGHGAFASGDRTNARRGAHPHTCRPLSHPQASTCSTRCRPCWQSGWRCLFPG